MKKKFMVAGLVVAGVAGATIVIKKWLDADRAFFEDAEDEPAWNDPDEDTL